VSHVVVMRECSVCTQCVARGPDRMSHTSVAWRRGAESPANNWQSRTEQQGQPLPQPAQLQKYCSVCGPTDVVARYLACVVCVCGCSFRTNLCLRVIPEHIAFAALYLAGVMNRKYYGPDGGESCCLLHSSVCLWTCAVR
jgi:hypothetical protein